MADKRSLQQLVMMGIASGILVVGGGLAAQKLMQATPHPSKKTQKLAQRKAYQKEIAANFDMAGDDTSGSPLIKDPFSELEDSNGNLGYHMMTEKELRLEVNQEGWDLYQSLDEEGKTLALAVASQRCDHMNLCKGLNACQTDQNACAGKGECKAKGKCAFSDKNLAVKVVAKKMAEKRANALKGNQTAPEKEKVNTH